MVIRRDQMQALEVVSEAAYVESAVAYFERYDPVTAASAGRAQLQAAARLGLASARRYGLSSGPALQLYLELMATLGSGFDSDPQYEWLNPFLEPRKDMGGIGRSRLIHFHVSAYLERARGPAGEFAKAALRRALDALPGLSTLDRAADEQAFGLLSWLHPERLEFVDSGAQAKLHEAARQAATGAGLLMAQASNVMLLLMFLFGHQVISDPLQSWVNDALLGPGSSEDRFQQLAQSARRRVETDLVYLESKVR
jgi:hypothetical protein